MNKLWDIKAPKNKWERQYVHMEYMRIVWHDLWEACRYIEVTNV